RRSRIVTASSTRTTAAAAARAQGWRPPRKSGNPSTSPCRASSTLRSLWPTAGKLMRRPPAVAAGSNRIDTGPPSPDPRRSRPRRDEEERGRFERVNHALQLLLPIEHAREPPVGVDPECLMAPRVAQVGLEQEHP